ncbi:putative zinc-binding oxidoreductase protein [Neofusicoccum parvum UCRNP2]|uniref:Putative zinc-binding oxidoreductase protein n=1 Tax=Botryosphaeria parva (strain UCR-NP2) TaxID=1287680 RepID=R1ESD4_BOTPV|nr:putative zinc-binding oxidoreductase protein [Neofusicoccum parvum UCRNP2]
MSVQRAIQIQGPKVAKLVTDAPIPALRPNHVRVKTVAVALNPADWKSVDYLGEPGLISGCDYSGIVEEVHPSVTHLRVGDKIAGLTHGANALNRTDGAFAEHIVVKAALCSKVPDSMTMEEAATLGAGVTTVAQGLYQTLRLPWPTAPTPDPFPVLVYGGSTATGTLAIQFAKLSGCEVLATCSPHNFELVRRLGADHVFDYRTPGVGREIRDAAGGRLAHVLDCISSPASAAICAEAIGSEGGKYSTLVPVNDFPRDDVTVSLGIAYTAFGEEFRKGDTVTPAKPEDFEFAARFWKTAEELLAQGKIKSHPPEVRNGGLGGILDGMEDMRQEKVSGVKLVYKV